MRRHRRWSAARKRRPALPVGSEVHLRLHLVGALLCAGPLLSVPTLGAAAAQNEELDAVKAELAETKQKLASTASALARVEQRLDQLEGAAPVAPAAAPSGPRIPPVNVDNPAISFVVDAQVKDDTSGSGSEFALGSGELFISAPIDPFLRGYASLNGTSEEGFDIEEAAVVTTSLPWNLTVKGGRFFANVGRLPHWHDEALPFVDRPPSIDRLLGGETQSEGTEVTWLAPIEHYVSLTAGVYNTIGAERNEELREEGFEGRRGEGELTFLVRPATYFDFTDTLNLELGATAATAPQDDQRDLYAVDATLRHQPGTSQLYQGFVFGTEWLWNHEKFQDVEIGTDPITGDPILGEQNARRNGGYAYLETFFGRRYSVGIRGDYSEDPFGESARQKTYSAFATWFPSEFHRLRFQVDQIDLSGADDDQRFTLQWTAFLGSHAHGFATR
jgi:hypothetical protein